MPKVALTRQIKGIIIFGQKKESFFGQCADRKGSVESPSKKPKTLPWRI